jgi:hypothetical protein
LPRLPGDTLLTLAGVYFGECYNIPESRDGMRRGVMAAVGEEE